MARSNVRGDRRILPQGAIIEMVVHGSYVKVSAIDPVTTEEVSIVGDPTAGEERLTRVAVRKLERMVFKKKYNRERAGFALARGHKQADPPSGWDL